MKKYFEYSFIYDLIVSIIIGLFILHFKDKISIYANLPTINFINNFISSLITVCSTLIGFLLTIITLIITFKNSFINDDKSEDEISKNNYDLPNVTVFEKKKSKEKTFYGTLIHKMVVSVFVSSTYQIALVLFFLMILQLKLEELPRLEISITLFCMFIFTFLAIIRSLYMFKLFLNVHLNDDEPQTGARM